MTIDPHSGHVRDVLPVLFGRGALLAFRHRHRLAPTGIASGIVLTLPCLDPFDRRQGAFICARPTVLADRGRLVCKSELSR